MLPPEITPGPGSTPTPDPLLFRRKGTESILDALRSQRVCCVSRRVRAGAVRGHSRALASFPAPESVQGSGPARRCPGLFGDFCFVTTEVRQSMPIRIEAVDEAGDGSFYLSFDGFVIATKNQPSRMKAAAATTANQGSPDQGKRKPPGFSPKMFP